MIKKRIIPTLTYRNNGLVKSIKFKDYRYLGDPIQAVRVYNLRDVDELIFLDISDQIERPNFELIREIMEDAFMPITIGGGIRSLQDIKGLFAYGADKVCLSTAALQNISLIKEATDIFGGQAIVISVDYAYDPEGNAYLITNPPYEVHSISPYEHMAGLSEMGISEFLLTCVDKEGTMNGYDLELLTRLKLPSNVGIILNGGAGSYEDMLRAFHSKELAGVAAASIFHYTEQTPLEARRFLKRQGINTRGDRDAKN